MDDSALEALHKVDALPIAYAQLFSMPRLSLLRKLYDGQKPRQEVPAEPELEALFATRQLDTLQFDWDPDR